MNEEQLIMRFKALKNAEYFSENNDKDQLSQQIDHNKTPAFIYSRVSTQFQLSDNSHSLETQVAQMRNYCDTHNIQIIKHFEDAGISGYDMDNRPQLKLMLNSLKPGYVVICAAMSRLGRNASQLLEITEIIKKAKADLILLDVNLDTSNPIGTAMFTFMAGMAQLERDQTSQRVSTVLTHLSEQGKLITKPPYGYKRTKGGLLIPIEKEQIVIEFIKIQINNAPNITASKLTKIVNKSFTNRKNKPFHPSTILSICRTHNIPLLNNNAIKEENKIPSLNMVFTNLPPPMNYNPY